MAIVALLRAYGHVTVKEAMQKYAKKGEGRNDPDAYARIVASRLHVDENAYLSKFTDQQVSRMAAVITGVETTQRGTVYWRDDPAMPEEIRERWLRYV